MSTSKEAEGTAQLYKPLHVFSADSSAEGGSCLILLNQDFINGLGTALTNHWHKFSLQVCADGGANRLYDFVDDHDRYLPHTICGDLDSARPQVLQYYKERGTRLVKSDDQDSTDFTKTVKEVLELRQKKIANVSSIYTVNAFGGRLDQTLGNLHTMMELEEALCGLPLFLLSEDSIAVMLRAGQSSIATDTGLERGYCGLLPIGEPCSSCTTTGLQWNLTNQAMRFGGLVSTSNLLALGHRSVHVTTSSPLLWTMSHTLCSPTAHAH